MSKQVTFPDYTCTGAHLACRNRGYEFVGCQEGAFPGQQQSALVTCSKPSVQESFQRAILSGLVAAAISAGIAYGVRGREGLLPAAALGGAIGLLFGDYV